MGIFSKLRQQPEKQTSSQRRPYSSSSSHLESPVPSRKLAKLEQVPQELSGQSVKKSRNGNDTAAPVAKPNAMLELELARQRAHIRELKANEQKLKQAVALSAQMGIPPDFVDKSMTKNNAPIVGLSSPPHQQRKDSGVAPSVEDSLAQAPEVVVRGMHSEFQASSGVTGASMQVSTYEGAGTWRHDPPTIPMHDAIQPHHQPQSQPSQTPSFDVAKAIVSISTLPWSKAFATLAESSSNPGLLLLLFALLYFTYSIIMARAMYLLLAFGLGIVVHHVSKSFFIAKQAELQGEYMRSIASNLQTVEILPPDVNSSRLLLPAGMNRVDELN